MVKFRPDVIVMTLCMLLAAGCAAPSQSTAVPAPTAAAQPAATQPAAGQGVALKIGGKVAAEKAWSEEQVRAMPTTQTTNTNQQGASETYTGVALNDLLKQAGVQAGATTLVFTGDGGQTAEASLSAVQACGGCILSFRSRGGFSLVLPGFPAAVQLKGVTAITVK